MPEISGPRVTGTDAERQLDDLIWRDLFGSEAGVIGDIDGSAYKLALPSDSLIVAVGSMTQPSLCNVGGFRHRIAGGDSQSVTMAAMGGTARTDVISAKLDLTGFTGAPGPVRLVATTGTTIAIPVLDDSSPGIEHHPLWALTRQPGQTLAQATVQRLFSRLSPVLARAVGAPLPTSAPLDTIVSQGVSRFRRVLDSALVPTWVSEGGVPVVSSISARNNLFSGQLRVGSQALVAGNLHTYDGAAWRFILQDSVRVNSNDQGLVTIPHGAGQTPRSVTVGLGPMGSEEQNERAKVLYFESDATNIYAKLYRTDTDRAFAGQGANSVGVTYVASF